MVENKGKIKPKKLEKLLKSVKTSEIKSHSILSKFTLVPVSELSGGFNKNYIIAGKVCGMISSEGEMPW